ncbi:hypothetical protein ABZP36_014853 [Zizania latifolia]
MARRNQILKRDQFGRFRPHTRAERDANFTPSDSSSLDDSDIVIEVCECGQLKVEGRPCTCVSASKRTRVLIALDDDDDDDFVPNVTASGSKQPKAQPRDSKRPHAEYMVL